MEAEVGGGYTEHMRPHRRRRATYKDLFDLPQHQVGEIVGGSLYASPRPASRHARVSSVLGIGIGGPFDQGINGPGGWWILDEPEIHLGADVLVPDLAGWRRERMPEYPDVAFFTLRPDWVCEVLSPSTAKLDRQHKMPVYSREGVEYAWLIDPSVKLVEVYILKKGAWQVHGVYGDEQVIHAPPFDAIPFDLWPLWGEAKKPDEE
ncbi:MAG: Uma2 family endonuclease [Myxococcota bacterium]